MWTIGKTHVTRLLKDGVEVSRQLVPEWLLPEVINKPEISNDNKIRLVSELLDIMGTSFPGLPEYMVETGVSGKPRFERLDGNILALQNRMPVIRFVVGHEYFSVRQFEEYRNVIWNVRKAMRNSIYPFSIIANMRYGYDGWEETDHPIVYKWCNPIPLQVFDVDELGHQSPAGVTYGWRYWNWRAKPEDFIDVFGEVYSADPESRNPCSEIRDFETDSINFFDRTKVRTEIDG